MFPRLYQYDKNVDTQSKTQLLLFVNFPATDAVQTELLRMNVCRHCSPIVSGNHEEQAVSDHHWALQKYLPVLAPFDCPVTYSFGFQTVGLLPDWLTNPTQKYASNLNTPALP